MDIDKAQTGVIDHDIAAALDAESTLAKFRFVESREKLRAPRYASIASTRVG
jgi:hypothetical protein